MAPTRRSGPRPSHRLATLALVGLLASGLPACALVAQPRPVPAGGPSLAPAGPVGYVACSNAVTPVELATHTAEAAIPLRISGTPEPGNFAITTSPDGRRAYVVTAEGATSGPSAPATPVTSGVTTSGSDGTSATGAAAPSGVGGENVVVPIDLVSQQAEPAHPHPGPGGHPRHRGTPRWSDAAGR